MATENNAVAKKKVSPAAVKELNSLKSLAGSLRTKKDEPERLSNYLASSQTAKQRRPRVDAWYKLVGGTCSNVNARDHVLQPLQELGVRQFLKMCQTPSFFVRGQELDFNVLFEPNSAMDLWMCLILNSALDTLLETAAGAVKTIKDNGGTAPEVFRAFMDAYKRQKGFDQWNMESVVGLRHQIYEAVGKFYKGRKRAQSPSEMPEEKLRKLDIIIVNGGESSLQSNFPVSSNPDPAANISEDQTTRSKLIPTPKALENAANVEQQYSTSKTTLELKQSNEDDASELSLQARLKFCHDASASLDKIGSSLGRMCTSEQQWKLETARGLVDGISQAGYDLGKLIENDLVGPLLAEQQAKKALAAAKKDFETWAAKRAIIDRAIKALEELKDL